MFEDLPRILGWLLFWCAVLAFVVGLLVGHFA